MPLTGNKGEWSELYTLFKLLGETKVFAGDENLNRIETLIYPIIKVLRREHDADYEYKVAGDLILISNGGEHFSIPVEKFKEQAVLLLTKIKESTGAAFSIPEVETFMSTAHCEKLKADSTDKADIKLVIHDLRTQTQPLLGFSIKSQLGGNSTLLNPGKTTNFIFNITNIELSESQVQEINEIKSPSKIKDRVTKIKELGGELSYCTMENSTFMNNLTLIDSLMPQIVSESLKLSFTTNKSKIKQIVNLLDEQNPLNFDMTGRHKFYEYKIKRLLTDAALGMVPSKVWNGVYDANGGYLIVKEDGDVICYHIYNKNEFENYLFANTKLETASSTRFGFGVVEQIEGTWKIKLNLQIRFIK